MNKSSLFWSILAMTFAVYGCGSDSSSDEPCVPGCSDNLQVTCDENGNAVKLVCKNGCDGLSCKQESTPQPTQCTPSCSDNLQISCDGEGNAVKTVCKNGCEGTACKASSEDAEKCEPSCKDNVQISCDGEGNAVETPCKNGCDGAVCKKGVDKEYVCKDELCVNGGKCDRGICVTEAMKKLEYFDDQSFCIGDWLIEDGEAYDCSKEGGCSVVVMENSDGGIYLEAGCRGERADKCTEEGQSVSECFVDPYDEYAYAGQGMCRKNVEGTFSIVDVEDHVMVKPGISSARASLRQGFWGCSSGQCNEDKTDCLPVNMFCEGNSIVTEAGGKILDVRECYQMVCAEEGNTASCMDRCEPEDYPVPEYLCESWNGIIESVLITKSCVPNHDERYYLQSKFEVCTGGCSDLTCHNVENTDPVEEEPEEDKVEFCDWNTYVQHCEGNKIIACEGGIVHEYDCSERSDSWVDGITKREDPSYCAVIDGIPGCYQRCSGENVPQKPLDICDTGSYYDSYDSLTVTCVNSDDPNDKNLYADVRVHPCEHDECDKNTGKCPKTIEDEYEHCSVDYQAKCKDNIAVSCDLEYTHMTSVDVCDDDEICVANGVSAACMTACEGAQARSSVCVSENYSRTEACEKIGDNWYETEWAREKYCEHGCDSETGKCRLLDEREGQMCVPSQKIDQCVGNVAITCESSTVKAVECGEDEVCILDEGHARCEYPCTKEYDESSCEADDRGIGEAWIYGCIKSQDGKLYAKQEHRVCGNGCDEETHQCKKLLETDGTFCSREFIPYCKGSILVSCHLERMTSIDCAKWGEGARCEVSGYFSGCRDW